MVYCWCMRRVPHSHKVLLAGMFTYFPRRVSISCIGGVCSVCLSHMESCSLECPHISGCVCMYLVLVLSAVCAPVSWSLACWNVNIFPKACLYGVLFVCAVCAPVSWSLARWNVNIFPKACLYGVLFVCAVCTPVSWSLARWNVNIFPKACLYGVLFVCAVCTPVTRSLARSNVNIFPEAFVYILLSRVRDFWFGFDGICAFTIVMGIFVLLRVQDLVIVVLWKCFCVSILFCHQIRSWFHTWTDSLAVV